MTEVLIEDRILLLPLVATLALFVLREVTVALLRAASEDAWTALRSRLTQCHKRLRRKERS